MKTILIIEDDCSIGDMLEEVLLQEGYRTARAYSGTEALLLLSRLHPDLILLDLMLPGLNGEDILPELAGIPVIVLSAKSDLDSKVSLLLGGAVDYVTKPFQIKELLARISVQLRLADTTKAAPNASASEAFPSKTFPSKTFPSEAFSSGMFSSAASKSSVLVFEDIRLDRNTRQATLHDIPVHLTRTEYAILKLLMQNPTQVITKSLLLERISEDTPDCTDSSLKMHISNLRKKLREADRKTLVSSADSIPSSTSGWDYIEAVWGIGFKLRGKTDNALPDL